MLLLTASSATAWGGHQGVRSWHVNFQTLGDWTLHNGGVDASWLGDCTGANWSSWHHNSSDQSTDGDGHWKNWNGDHRHRHHRRHHQRDDDGGCKPGNPIPAPTAALAFAAGLIVVGRAARRS